MKKQKLPLLPFFIILVFAGLIIIISTLGKNQPSPAIDEDYNPQINPSDFTTYITNPYFSMPIGKKMVYEAKITEGTERIEILIPGWTKEIMGVETLVFWDRVYLNGDLIEDTRDYIAQDKKGSVWYFGEHVDNYANGVLTDHQGAWLAGVDGALPGIWMKGSPKVGDQYWQEYYKGVAEDMGRVDAVGVRVTTPAGAFSDCVKVFEWTPLESTTAYKYHCPGAAATVLEEEGNERVALIGLDLAGAKCIRLPPAYAQEGVLPGLTLSCAKGDLVDLAQPVSQGELKPAITEEQARAIALQEVSGEVTDVVIENKFGKMSYVVEIKTTTGETDVVIDVNTGEILAIE